MIEEFFTELNILLKRGLKIDVKKTDLLGGTRYDFTIGDLKYVFRTTDYYGDDYIMLGHRLFKLSNPSDSLRMSDAFIK